MIIILSFIPYVDLLLIDDIDNHGITLKDYRHEEENILRYYLISIDYNGLELASCISEIYDVDDCGCFKIIGVDEIWY